MLSDDGKIQSLLYSTWEAVGRYSPSTSSVPLLGLGHSVQFILLPWLKLELVTAEFSGWRGSQHKESWLICHEMHQHWGTCLWEKRNDVCLCHHLPLAFALWQWRRRGEMDGKLQLLELEWKISGKQGYPWKDDIFSLCLTYQDSGLGHMRVQLLHSQPSFNDFL